MADWSTIMNVAYTAISVIGILLAGAVWVMTIANKLSSKIAIIENNASEFKQKLSSLEDAERKNEAFRHKHSHDIKTLQAFVELIKADIEKQMINIKNDIEKQIKQSHDLILAKLDLAIEKNKIHDNNGKDS